MYDAVEELSTERFNTLVAKHGGLGSAAVSPRICIDTSIQADN